ncbi:hypothetical protein PAHAL_9G161900 [Panicum hallii]|uniref:Uncharacterized protein n=1 Tax=Panicum hallii TaxID=206008 RepID=A0A2T8I1E3_9POAL|nr:hypothetical protein PAHAL_9G161900 [Panicum hallii]
MTYQLSVNLSEAPFYGFYLEMKKNRNILLKGRTISMINYYKEGFSAKTTWPALPLTLAATSHPSPVTPLPSSLRLQSPAHPKPNRQGISWMRRQGARRNACARRRRACSPASAPRGPPPPSPSRRPRARGGVDVAATATRARGRGGGRVTVGAGERCHPQLIVFFFAFCWTRPPCRRTSAFPSMSRFVRFFPPSPSFLPVSSPFYSVGSSLSSRTAVLVKEGQQVGIFPESESSELELGV